MNDSEDESLEIAPLVYTNEKIVKPKVLAYSSTNIDDSDFPYNKDKQRDIKAYFKNKINPKKHMRYTFTNEGDLETYDVKKGEVVNTINLNYYMPSSKEKFEENNTARIDAIIDIETQIDLYKSLLREAYKEYTETNDAKSVVEYNIEIMNLEKQKMLIRSPIRQLNTYDDSIEKRSIYFDMPFEKRKSKDISYMVYRDFPLWKLYGIYTDSKDIHEATKQKSLSLGEIYLNNGKVARIFNNVDDINGFLSIFNVKDFVYKNTKYSSPYQTFEVLRMKENGFEDVANKFMSTRAITAIKIKAKQFSQPIKNIKAVWKEILREFYQQNSEFVEKLIKTNDDVLIFGNTMPYLGGVGLAGQEEIIDVGKWLYPNIVGEVLMELRGELKENSESKKEAFTKSVVTENELANKKKGAIISAMKK